MKPDDKVYRWMTPCPQTIERDATMADARSDMRRLGVRHFPVVDGGELVGIVSERDLSFAERFVDPRETCVGDVMTKDPYVVVPYAALADVAHEMAEKKYGAAIVIDRGNIIGVFTMVDALRAIAEGHGRREAMASRAQG